MIHLKKILVATDFSSHSENAVRYAVEFAKKFGVPPRELTRDHVLPISRGGSDKWENVVAACSPCNLRKGSKLLRQTSMHLRRVPRQPGAEELRNQGRKFPPHHLHESWMDFLYWDAELEA